ncbi:uncharacterized protein LOC132564471 isoform X2 [Ylistrum balloti]|uniref:uncharacterized protein LOC132564471 isoform X2 n=1 Tax=Ylistrum balloti TaxID=509963 RepID=UPI002905DB7C|nr:uncharacterized protein LOC132564471 isoform X2 [Ylistrum balloti]
MPATRNHSPQVTGRVTRNASPRQSDQSRPDSRTRQASPRGTEKKETKNVSLRIQGKDKTTEIQSKSSVKKKDKSEQNGNVKLTNEKSEFKSNDASKIQSKSDNRANTKVLKNDSISNTGRTSRNRGSLEGNIMVRHEREEKEDQATDDRTKRRSTRKSVEELELPVAAANSKVIERPASRRSIKEAKDADILNQVLSAKEKVNSAANKEAVLERLDKGSKVRESELENQQCDDVSNQSTKSKTTAKVNNTQHKIASGKNRVPEEQTSEAMETSTKSKISVSNESDEENIGKRRGQKRPNADNIPDREETKRKKVSEDKDIDGEGKKGSGKTTVTLSGDDTFSPRRSGRGLVPNRRFKDMEMNFSPASKRRQSADADADKSKSRSSAKKKAKDKDIKLAPVVLSKSGMDIHTDQSERKDDHIRAEVDKTDHQDVVMETVDTNWIEEEVVPVNREIVIQPIEEDTRTVTVIVEQDPTEHALSKEQNTTLDRSEAFVSEENLENIAQQTMTLLIRENELGSSGENFMVTTLSEDMNESQTPSSGETHGVQVDSGIEEMVIEATVEETSLAAGVEKAALEATVTETTMETGVTDTAMETGVTDTAIEDGVTGTTIEATGTEAAIEASVMATAMVTTMTETATEISQEATADVTTETPNKEFVATVSKETDAHLVTGKEVLVQRKENEDMSMTNNDKATEIEQPDQTVKNLEGYKLIRLQDMVQELGTNAKASELSATAVTNLDKDVDEDIIRKILLSNKTFKDTDEIEIQFIGGDSQEEVNETNILSEKIISMRNLTKSSNVSTISTQTPIISSRVANLPGKEKKAAQASPSKIKTIRVNIQRPDGVEETKELDTEEGKPQEFVIVHLPEGTKVTRPQVKDDKNETVPFDQTDDGTFICGICDYTTPKKANWYKHKKKHMAQKPHSCNKCGYQAATSSNLKRHLAIHDDIRDFQCDFCFMTFRQKIHLERHVKYRHEVKKVKCPLCDYVCANENPDLKVHIKRRHLPQDSQEGSVRAFSCEECGAMAVNRKDLKQHMKFHRKGPELKLYCEHCSFVTDCESRLRRHMFIHTNEKPFQCGLCDYRGTQKEHVLRHMKSQHHIDIQKKGRSSDEASVDGSTDSRDLLLDKKPYKTDYSSQEKIFACNHCTMKFAKLLNLYKHLHAQHKAILPEQGEDEYLCVVCDYRTGSKKNLLVHMRKHNVQDQTPPSHVYSCVLCRYMNPKRRNLFQHMKKKHNIEIVMRDDGSTSCFLTDSNSTVSGKDDSVQNILTVGDIVTTTTDDSQLQIVMDACEKSAVQVQNVINIEDIANCVSNPQSNGNNIIILEQGQSNTFVQHEAAEAIEGLQALAEQPGIMESQEVIADPDSQALNVEEVQTSKGLGENIMETEIVTMETEILKSFQQENVPETKKEKESDIQLSEDQLMNLSSGDYVEINGEMYKVEISAEEANNGELDNRVTEGEEFTPTLVEESQEQHVAVSDENAFQEFVQLMTECTDDSHTTSIASHTTGTSEALTDSQTESTALQSVSSDSNANSSEQDSLTVLAEITNAASEVETEFITIQGSAVMDHTEPSNVMTVVNSTSVDEGSASVTENQ